MKQFEQRRKELTKELERKLAYLGKEKEQRQQSEQIKRLQKSFTTAEVVDMHVNQGMSAIEIASEFNVGVNEVKRKINSAL